MSNNEQMAPTGPRYLVEPDPAWDWSELQGGVLTVELSWRPDGLAGRLEEIVASPELVRALQKARITGFTTSKAQGYFREDSFGVDEGTAPPELLQLHVGTDDAQDLSYQPLLGLIVTESALTVLRRLCTRMEVQRLRDQLPQLDG